MKAFQARELIFSNQKKYIEQALIAVKERAIYGFSSVRLRGGVWGIDSDSRRKVCEELDALGYTTSCKSDKNTNESFIVVQW